MPRKLVQDGFRGWYGWESRFNSVMRMSVDALWSIKAKNELEKHIMANKLRHISKGEDHTRRKLNGESKTVRKDFVKMKASTEVLREYSFYRQEEREREKNQPLSAPNNKATGRHEAASRVKRSQTFHHGQSRSYDRSAIHHNSATPQVETKSKTSAKSDREINYDNRRENNNKANKPIKRSATDLNLDKTQQQKERLIILPKSSKERSFSPSSLATIKEDRSEQVSHSMDVSGLPTVLSPNKTIAKDKSGEQPPSLGRQKELKPVSALTRSVSSCTLRLSDKAGDSARRVRFPSIEINEEAAAGDQPGIKDAGDESGREAQDEGDPNEDPSVDVSGHYSETKAADVSEAEISQQPAREEESPDPIMASENGKDHGQGSAEGAVSLPHMPGSIDEISSGTPVSRAGSGTRFPTVSPTRGAPSPSRAGQPSLTKAAFSPDRPGRLPSYSPQRANLLYDDTDDDEKLKDYILPSHPGTLARHAAGKAKPLSLAKRLALRSRRNLLPEDHHKSRIFPADCKTAFSFKRFIERKTEKVVEDLESDKIRMRKMTRLANKMALPDLVQRRKTTSAIFRDYKEYKDEHLPVVAEPERFQAPSPLSKIKARMGRRDASGTQRQSLVRSSVP